MSTRNGRSSGSPVVERATQAGFAVEYTKPLPPAYAAPAVERRIWQSPLPDWVARISEKRDPGDAWTPPGNMTRVKRPVARNEDAGMSVPVTEGLMAALRFIDGIGMARIARWDAMLTKRLRDGLAKIPKARVASPADPRFSAAITTFRVDGVKAKALQDALWERRVRVRAQGDDRGVRLSAHLYVNPDNIDAVLDVTSRLAASSKKGPAGISPSRPSQL